MHVDAGELNKRIEIVRRDRTKKTPNGYDEITETAVAVDPGVVHRCWAKFTQTSGTELVKANADFGEERVRFLIRWTDRAIDRKMVVRYGGSRYEIEYINDYGDGHQYIELWCKWLSRDGRP